MLSPSMLVVASAAWSVAAAGPPIVAVFDIEDRGAKLKQEVVSNLTDYLSAKLTATGGYHVIPNDEVRTRLRSQKAESYKKCYDQSCQIEVGKELAAGKSVSTKLLRIGKTCVVTVSIYDLAEAATEHAATHEGPCSEEGVMGSISKVVETLTRTKKTTPAAVVPPPPPARPEVEPVSRELFRETFADNSRKWRIWNNGQYYNAGFGSSDYWIETKNERCSIEMVSTGGSLPTNFDVEWETVWRSGENNRAYGLVIGENSKDYYLFATSGNGWTYGARYIDAKRMKDPIPWKKDTANVGEGRTSNYHKLEVRGQQMTYFTNGRYIAQVPLVEIDVRAGMIGWSVCNKQRAAVKQIVVTQVP